MPKVLVIHPIHDHGLQLLYDRNGLDVEVVTDDSVTNLVRKLADATAVTLRNTAFTAQLAERSPALKIVSRHGVGYDNVDVAALTKRGIPLALAIGANTVSVAEQVLYFMLTFAKCGFAYDRATRAGEFAHRNRIDTIDLWQRTLLIIGLGRIGREVAARAGALGMRLTAYDPYIPPAVFEAHDCERTSDLNNALANADVVTLHVPRNDETRHLIGAGELARMKSSAFLINTARGGIVDETALHAALSVGAIAGAGLDVFEQEPVPATHPLLALDNVVVSPHSAALTREGSVRMAVSTARNVLDALDGKLDPNVVVNKETLLT